MSLLSGTRATCNTVLRESLIDYTSVSFIVYSSVSIYVNLKHFIHGTSVSKLLSLFTALLINDGLWPRKRIVKSL